MSKQPAALLGANQLDEAERLLGLLAHEFSQEREVQSLADVLRWREQQRLVVPAEDALRDILRPPYRDDPEAAVARLADVQVDSLPDDWPVASLVCVERLRSVGPAGWLARVVPLRAGHQPQRGIRPLDTPESVRSRERIGAPRLEPGQTVLGSLPRGARELQTR